MRKGLTGAAVLGVSLILCAVVFGLFFYQSRRPEKTITVVGAATQRMNSDVVKWRVSIVRNVPAAELKSGYTGIKDDLAAFRELLEANGIPPADLTVSPVNTEPVYTNYGEQGGAPVGYNLRQSLYVVSQDLAKLERLALNPQALTEKGIVLQMSSLEYYPSKLADIKKELLAEATRDARARAAAIAKSSGDRIDRIQTAKVGVFQITEPYSTDVSDYGIYNTSTREKDITVTVNVTFTLK